MEVSDWINLGTLATTIIGLRFIYKQLKLARKDYEAKFTYQKREKATEMAKEFEQFVVNCTFITNLLERTSLTKILSSLKINDNNKLIFEFIWMIISSKSFKIFNTKFKFYLIF